MRPRSLIRAVGLPLALGFISTIGLAWILACIDIPDAGRMAKHRYHGDQTSAVEYPGFSAVPDGICTLLHVAPGRVLIHAICFGHDVPSVFYTGIDLSEFRPEPPHQLLPAGLIPLALPWLSHTPWPAGAAHDWRLIEASGWPMLALASEQRPTTATARATLLAFNLPGNRSIGPIMLSAYPSPRLLPLRPLWLGLAVDIACFAAAWALLLQLLAALHRRLRPPWACPTCRYDRRGLAPDSPCPECGRPAVV